MTFGCKFLRTNMYSTGKVMDCKTYETCNYLFMSVNKIQNKKYNNLLLLLLHS